MTSPAVPLNTQDTASLKHPMPIHHYAQRLTDLQCDSTYHILPISDCPLKWSVTHHSTRWAGLPSTVATTCAPPAGGRAHSDLTILSAWDCTDDRRPFCFRTHRRCPTASPGDGKNMSRTQMNTMFQQRWRNVTLAFSYVSGTEYVGEWIFTRSCRKNHKLICLTISYLMPIQVSQERTTGRQQKACLWLWRQYELVFAGE